MHLFRLNDSFAHECRLRESFFADDFRVVIVGFIGCSVAVISIIENAILFYVFATSRKLRRQNYANPVLLALFDSVVSVCYMLTAPVQVLGYHYHVDAIMWLWANGMQYVYCLQHIALTVSNFILVVASVERFLANGQKYWEKRLLVFLVSNKAIVLCIIICLSLLFKGTLFFETRLLHFPWCTDAIEQLIPIWQSTGTVAQSVRFWIRRIFTIIIPFIILALCNLHIVLHLRRRKRKFDQIITQSQRIAAATTTPVVALRKTNASLTANTGSFQEQYNEKKGVRVATRTLVMVVGCYLISNSMTTVINIMEWCDPVFVRYEHYYGYLVSSDMAALLTIVGCALRLPIYIFNDNRIRKAIFRAVLRLRYRRSERLKDLQANNLEKWSIVVVSNSLRSNLTGAISQHHDYGYLRDRKSFSQLGILVQNRRKFLVEMTMNLGRMSQMPQRKADASDETFLTDIQEEEHEHSELLHSDNDNASASAVMPSYGSFKKRLSEWHVNI